MARNIHTVRLFDVAGANGDSDIYVFPDPKYNVLPDRIFFVVDPNNAAALDIKFQFRVDGIWTNVADPSTISSDDVFYLGPYDIVADAVKGVIENFTAGDVTAIMRAFKF